MLKNQLEKGSDIEMNEKEYHSEPNCYEEERKKELSNEKKAPQLPYLTL
jgi:hypothetical protein